MPVGTAATLAKCEPDQLDDTLTEQTLATAKIFAGRVEEATSRTNAKKTT